MKQIKILLPTELMVQKIAKQNINGQKIGCKDEAQHLGEEERGRSVHGPRELGGGVLFQPEKSGQLLLGSLLKKGECRKEHVVEKSKAME